MTWTTEFPTKPGYYWIRNYAFDIDPKDIVRDSDIVQVEREYYGGDDYGPISHFRFTGNEYPIKQSELLQAEWYGPIEPPE